MLLWILLAALTAVVVTLVLRPLTLGAGEVRDASSADIAVYKDQLAEIDTDLDRGLINADEAKSARAELSRRLLKRAEADNAHANHGGSGDSEVTPRLTGGMSRDVLGMALGLALPMIAIAVYLNIGSPGLPAQPHAERITVAPENASADELIAKVEAQLRQNPEDGRGWEVLAPVYRRFERYGEAANAYAQAIRLLGETPERLAGFAQSDIVAQNGLVSERARLAYQRLLNIRPNSPEALYWLAQAKEQDGNMSGALAQYQRMLDGAPKDAAWRSSVEERVAALSGLAQAKSSAQQTPEAAADNSSGGSVPAPGPTAEDVAAASEMSAEDRGQFINQMVNRLATRLKENGNDAGGWKRLIRAYMVMGRESDAKQALRDARKNFARSERMQMEFDELAKGLGLDS
ncbi:MAG: c-type cytochrome biogenesis protein CcmI [Pseudomonadota bacterium]